jgi:hypothetical protein
MMVALMHRRLVVDRSPVTVSGLLCKQALNPLEEQNVWLWLMDFIVFPAQALWKSQPMQPRHVLRLPVPV